MNKRIIPIIVILILCASCTKENALSPSKKYHISQSSCAFNGAGLQTLQPAGTEFSYNTYEDKMSLTIKYKFDKFFMDIYLTNAYYTREGSSLNFGNRSSIVSEVYMNSETRCASHLYLSGVMGENGDVPVIDLTLDGQVDGEWIELSITGLVTDASQAGYSTGKSSIDVDWLGPGKDILFNESGVDAEVLLENMHSSITGSEPVTRKLEVPSGQGVMLYDYDHTDKKHLSVSSGDVFITIFFADGKTLKCTPGSPEQLEFYKSNITYQRDDFVRNGVIIEHSWIYTTYYISKKLYSMAL